MNEQIFILDKNKSLVELNEKDFINESQFQELLEKYPKLIPGSLINPENRIEGRPSFSIKLLEKQSEFDKFVRIYDWFLNEIEK